MFRENTSHRKVDTINDFTSMDKRLQRALMESWSPLFYDLVFSKIDETPLAPLYNSNTGRPNFPINIFLSLEFIKHMKNYTDEELLEQFRFNYQVMYAVGIRNIGESYFSVRTLYEFRERIYNYTKDHPEEEDLIFKQFNELTYRFLKVAKIKTNEQRCDSTEIVPNIKKAGRLSLAFDVLINAVKAIPEEEVPDFIKLVLKAEFKTEILYKSKSNSKSRLENLLELSYRLIEYINGRGEVENLKEIQILKRFFNEQTTSGDGKTYFKVKENKEILSSSLQSAYDEDITYRKKAGKESSGYVLNLSETCSKENPVQLITDYTLEKNIVTDIDMLIERLPVIIARTKLRDMYLDGGYYSERLEELCLELGVNLHYTSMTGRKINSSKLPLTSFNIENCQTVISCPMGIAPIKSEYKKSKKLVVAEFDREKCCKCPLKDTCRVEIRKTKSIFRFAKKSIHAAERRAKIESKENRKQMVSKRAAIEGTNSSLKRSQGAGKLRVRGLIKSTLAIGMKIIGHNFKQIIRFFRKTKQTLQEITIPIIKKQGMDLYFEV